MSAKGEAVEAEEVSEQTLQLVRCRRRESLPSPDGAQGAGQADLIVVFPMSMASSTAPDRGAPLPARCASVRGPAAAGPKALPSAEAQRPRSPSPAPAQE